MKRTYYYTYKVQCTAVGWEDYYYLGQHTTSNLDDGYKGSGTKLREYYKQYPEDYIFTILEFYSNKTELNIAEQKLIGDLWKTDEYCLNMNAGGHGSWAAAQAVSAKNNKGRPKSEEHKRKISESHKGRKNPKISEVLKGRPTWIKGKHHSEEAKRKMSESCKGKNNPMYDKHHSEETKRKMSESRKGKNNPMYSKPAPILGKHRVYRDDGTYYYSF